MVKNTIYSISTRSPEIKIVTQVYGNYLGKLKLQNKRIKHVVQIKNIIHKILTFIKLSVQLK